jgi:predicted nucleic acid-binding protein
MSAEPGRQFVDSNVLVYAHDASAHEKQHRARALIEALWAGGNGCLSVQVLQEFFVTVTRKVPRPLDSRQAARVVEALSRWRVHAPQPDDVLAAISLHERRRISFWDALVVHSALRLECHVLWSEDLAPGRVEPGLVVKNPFA